MRPIKVPGPPTLGLVTTDGEIVVKRGPVCWHSHLVVDGEARTVTCQKCKVVFDPIEALVHLTREWHRYEAVRENARRESERATVALEEVRRQLRNAKAQLRRLRPVQ